MDKSAIAIAYYYKLCMSITDTPAHIKVMNRKQVKQNVGNKKQQ